MSRDISNQYMRKLIDSLNSDYDKWTMKKRGGLSDGGSWIEYRSPTYTNSKGRKIVFVHGWTHREFIGAFINNPLLWKVSWIQWYNIFSPQTRQMWAGYRRMKRRCIEKEQRYIQKEMKDSL